MDDDTEAFIHHVFIIHIFGKGISLSLLQLIHHSKIHGKLVSSFSCHCPPGFEGDRCEINIDDCVENKCENNATCVDLVEEYTCQCNPGYTGQFLPLQKRMDLCNIHFFDTCA